MRGAGDQFTIGERIAFYRARRGYTQVQLANLVDEQRNDNVPAIRDALMTPRRLSRVLYDRRTS
jgi:transcriptional regulator with XRE-family HTH domain